MMENQSAKLTSGSNLSPCSPSDTIHSNPMYLQVVHVRPSSAGARGNQVIRLQPEIGHIR